jgi:hypothetical protein
MLKLRNPFTCALAGLAAVLIFSSVAKAQAQQGTHKASVWKYDGGNRALGSGGPAPFHDLSGSWAGPRSGAGVADSKPGDLPSLKALGQQLFAGRKSLQKYDPAGTNDPVVRTCDPLGFPRVDRYSIMAMAFATMSDRIIVLYPFQQQGAKSGWMAESFRKT